MKSITVWSVIKTSVRIVIKARVRIFCICILLIIVWRIQSYRDYLHTKRNEDGFYQAQKEGNVQRAFAIAKELPHSPNYRTTKHPDMSWATSVALELAGQYDAALEKYQKLADYDDYLREHGRNTIYGRIAYKQGRYEDSFRFYSAYVAQTADRFGVTADALDDPSSVEGKKFIRGAITGEVDVVTMRLSPFWEFSEFRAFMEDEYARLDTSGQYEFEMNFIRKIDESKDVLDKEIERRLSSEKFREYLKKERIENVNKLPD